MSMKLIKNARIYRMDLPEAGALAGHLAEMAHHEMGSLDFSTSGFIPPTPYSDSLVVEFSGGMAFALRYDEKIVPASIVNAEAKKRIAQIEEDQDARLGRKARQEMREQVFSDLCIKALTRTTNTICFYDTTHRYLIVPAASKRIAETVTTNLLKVVGSIKVTSIYVYSAKGGLTARLSDYLNGNVDAFDQFIVGGECGLESSEGKKVAVKQKSMTDAADGLREAIANGAQVAYIRIGYPAITFRLTADFVLKGIQFAYDVEGNDEYENAEELWKHEAYLQLANLSEAINGLCEMLGYKPEE